MKNALRDFTKPFNTRATLKKGSRVEFLVSENLVARAPATPPHLLVFRHPAAAADAAHCSSECDHLAAPGGCELTSPQPALTHRR